MFFCQRRPLCRLVLFLSLNLINTYLYSNPHTYALSSARRLVYYRRIHNWCGDSDRPLSSVVLESSDPNRQTFWIRIFRKQSYNIDFRRDVPKTTRRRVKLHWFRRVAIEFKLRSSLMPLIRAPCRHALTRPQYGHLIAIPYHWMTIWKALNWEDAPISSNSCKPKRYW